MDTAKHTATARLRAASLFTSFSGYSVTVKIDSKYVRIVSCCYHKNPRDVKQQLIRSGSKRFSILPRTENITQRQHRRFRSGGLLLSRVYPLRPACSKWLVNPLRFWQVSSCTRTVDAKTLYCKTGAEAFLPGAAAELKKLKATFCEVQSSRSLINGE